MYTLCIYNIKKEKVSKEYFNKSLKEIIKRVKKLMRSRAPLSIWIHDTKKNDFNVLLHIYNN